MFKGDGGRDDALSAAAAFREMAQSYLACWQDEISITGSKFGLGLGPFSIIPFFFSLSLSLGRV